MVRCVLPLKNEFVSFVIDAGPATGPSRPNSLAGVAGTATATAHGQKAHAEGSDGNVDISPSTILYPQDPTAGPSEKHRAADPPDTPSLLSKPDPSKSIDRCRCDVVVLDGNLEVRV